MTRAAVLRDPRKLPASASWASSRPWRTSLGMELSPIDVRDAGEIERGIDGICARSPNGGLIVTVERDFANCIAI